MTVATEQNVAKVKCLIKKDPRLTENEIKYTFNHLSGSLNRFLRSDVWKRCALLVAHQLTEEQKRDSMDWCLHVLRKFDGGLSERVWDIVTGTIS